MEKETKTTEYLKCVLTEEEIKKIGADLAHKYSQIQDLEAQKKSVNYDFKARIDGLTAAVSICASTIQNGYEFRTIEYDIESAYSSGVILTIRIDTGEIVKEQKMTPKERQEQMFDGENQVDI